jgi:signal transduction histidine kinase
MASIVEPAVKPRINARVGSVAALSLAVCVALWLTSLQNYLLFHSIAEIFSIAVAAAVFMISWSSRGYPEARPFVILGIGYLFVAFLDVLHTLTYPGMELMPAGQDYATKLWIAARGLQAATTLAFTLLVRLRRTAPAWLAFVAIGAVTIATVLSIFAWDVFPLCFVEGAGLTPFKKASEYVISAMLAGSIVLVAGTREGMSLQERRLLIAAFGVNIASELVFTLYVSSSGYQNLIGHLLKIGSICLAYQALFASKVRSRIALIRELEASKRRLEHSEAELRTANLSKDKFFSILAHDLRNPISGLLTLSELLAYRFDKLDERRIREMCLLLHDGARQSSELLECILQWARAQMGKLETQPSPVRLAELCEGIADLQQPVAKNKEIRLLCQVRQDAMVYADENMIATVLRNVLSNAVKFTPRGGEVVCSSRAQDAWECITIRDTGIGMGPEDLRKLFRIDVHFTNAGTEAERGAGLGLILCKELVELNKGLIGVESEPGKGSTFMVRLPRGAQP